MIISIDWLEEYIEIPFSDDELCEKLTILGLESSLDKKTRTLDIELTPNRPDCMSYLGVAREASILTNKKIKLPKISKNLNKNKSKKLTITSNSLDDCPRYSAVIVNDINVSKSPIWLKDKLKKNGIQSINSIVDISNLILLEFGHPIHIFDFDKLKTKNINIRRAKSKEKFLTLDGKNRILNNKNLLICDSDIPIAIAGVMGGKDTEVTNSTKNILIECAYFEPICIRRSSKGLGLSTDASKRFERGVDFDDHNTVINRTLSLISDISEKNLLNIEENDFYPKEIIKKEISFKRQNVSKQIGVELNDDFIKKTLNALDITFSYKKDDFKCIIPSFRPDLERPIDLTEEFGRVYGFDKIPNKLSYTSDLNTIFSDKEEYVNRMKNYFSSIGFNEVMSNSLTNPDKEFFFPNKKFIKIANPLSNEMSSMRTNLITGLVNAVSYNIRHGEKNLSFYEYGTVFQINDNNRKEKFNFSGILTGKKIAKGWRQTELKNDFYLLKGYIANFLNTYNIDHSVSKSNKYEFLNDEIAFNKGEKNLFILGKINKNILEKFKINQEIYLFDSNLLNLSTLNYFTRYKNIPIYPSITRDLSLTVLKSIEIDRIITNIKELSSDLLENVRLYDIYEGDQIDSNCKSVTFELTFRSMNTTLIDEDVDEIMNKIILETSSTLNAKLR